MDADGTTSGFDPEMIEAVKAVVDVPVIASGGAGVAWPHFVAARGRCDAVLAASVFHYGTLRHRRGQGRPRATPGFAVR